MCADYHRQAAKLPRVQLSNFPGVVKLAVVFNSLGLSKVTLPGPLALDQAPVAVSPGRAMPLPLPRR